LWGKQANTWGGGPKSGVKVSGGEERGFCTYEMILVNTLTEIRGTAVGGTGYRKERDVEHTCKKNG